MIYFIQAESNGHIKIGFTDGLDANDRLRELQVGSPVRLVLLGTIPGDRGTECDLHRQFSHAHVHGEWFRPSPDLLQMIGFQGKADVQSRTGVETRFVTIKVLTVNNKQVTQALFKQIPEEDIIDWWAPFELDGVQPEGSDWLAAFLKSKSIWGKVLETQKDQNGFYVVWEDHGELRKCRAIGFIPSAVLQGSFDVDRFTWLHDGSDRYLNEDKLSPKEEKILGLMKKVAKEAKRCFSALDQLFIGV